MSRFLNKQRRGFCLKFVVLIFCCASLPVLAQTKISLTNAIQEGLSNNFGVRIAKNEAAIAKQNVSLGNAGILPNVSAYASYDRSSLDAKVETATGAELDRDVAVATLTTAGVQAQWTLFDGTGMFLEYEKLKLLSNQGELELKIMMEKAVHDITIAYCDIIRQQQILKAYQQHMEISNFQLMLAKDRRKSGLGSEQEELQAGVAHQADTVAWTKQNTAVLKAKIRLNQLMAVDLLRAVETEDSIVLTVVPPQDQLIKQALQMNNYQQMAEENLRLSALEVKSLKTKQIPKVQLRGAYGFYENETESSFISYNRTLGPQIGMSAGINLFDGMNLRRKIQNARLNTENEGIRLKEQEQRLTAAILETFYDYQNQLQVLSLGLEGLKMAEKNMSIAKESFRVGMMSALQLREAQDDLFRASSNVVEARYNAKAMETGLLRLSGILIK